jgi:6-phosphogluconolactonase
MTKAWRQWAASISIAFTLSAYGGDSLSVSASGGFTFPTSVASGSAHAAMVQTQPTASGSGSRQTRPVQSGSGTIGAADLHDASVFCSEAARFVYVANSGSNNISAYAIDPISGALTALSGSPFATGTQPVSLTVTPNGKFAYTSNNGSNDVSAYTVDTAGGGLTPVSGSPFSTGTTRFSVLSYPNSPLVVDPSGTFAFVTVPSALSAAPPTFNQSPDFAAFTINAASGTLAPVSGSPFGTFGTPLSVVDRSGRSR